jgi:hypothetical protein
MIEVEEEGYWLLLFFFFSQELFGHRLNAPTPRDFSGRPKEYMSRPRITNRSYYNWPQTRRDRNEQRPSDKNMCLSIFAVTFTSVFSNTFYITCYFHAVLEEGGEAIYN